MTANRGTAYSLRLVDTQLAGERIWNVHIEIAMFRLPNALQRRRAGAKSFAARESSRERFDAVTAVIVGRAADDTGVAGCRVAHPHFDSFDGL